MRVVKSGRALERLIARLERRGGSGLERVMPQAEKIVREVRAGGDRALLRARKRFDGLPQAAPLRVSPEQMARAWREIPAELQGAMRSTAARIRAFAQAQMPQTWEREAGPGVRTAQLVRPLGAVGCYVPAGRHPLPSTLLMTVVPAQVAGVRRIAVASPGAGRETLAAAHLLGIDEFYAMGGAQAIAALAYGTASVPRVDKIVGPGNLYVTAAKKAVAFDCAVDMLAGPTEIAVASDAGWPEWIAADLVAQAEHDPEALALLITTNAKLAKRVVAEAERQAKGNAVARRVLAKNGYACVTASIAEARDITNRLAPEHLTVDSREDLAWVESAGSVFVGPWSAQPLGDYISGPNHTLPTGGAAAARGGLSVMDYVKLITVQEYTAAGVAHLGAQAMLLAEAEGLQGHAAAIRQRLADA